MADRPPADSRATDSHADFNARSYSIAYQMALAGGVGHTTAVQHATLVARAADDSESVYLCARAAGCTEADAIAAARAH